MMFIAVFVIEFFVAFFTFHVKVLLWTWKIVPHSCAIEAAGITACLMFDRPVVRRKTPEAIILALVEEVFHTSDAIKVISAVVEDNFIFVFLGV